jgi:hypothetical protein
VNLCRFNNDRTGLVRGSTVHDITGLIGAFEIEQVLDRGAQTRQHDLHRQHPPVSMEWRPYRGKLGVEAALSEPYLASPASQYVTGPGHDCRLLAGKGKLYDSVVVDALSSVVDQKTHNFDWRRQAIARRSSLPH